MNSVKHEAFLALEKSLTTRLSNAWRRRSSKTLKKIRNLVKVGDFAEAYKLIESFNLWDILKRNRKFIELMGMSSILLGASRLGDVRDSVFMVDGKPELLNKATETFNRMLGENGIDEIKKKARGLIRNEEVRLATIGKKPPGNFAKEFVSSVIRTGKIAISTASSLHTSRLSAWGAVVESTVLNIQNYVINEILDRRICPVCESMHGQIFPVKSVKTYLETLLSVENPNDLKFLAPWPKQDAKSIKALQDMTKAEVIGAGWQTPPFHPKCRGILQPAGSQQINLGQTISPNKSRITNPTQLAETLLGN